MEKELDYCHEASHAFLQSLVAYHRAGIRLSVDGVSMQPGRVAGLCLFREKNRYMSDYISDETGKILEVHFDKIE